MEKRGVRTDPLDQTAVQFIDTGMLFASSVPAVWYALPDKQLTPTLPAVRRRDCPD